MGTGRGGEKHAAVAIKYSCEICKKNYGKLIPVCLFKVKAAQYVVLCDSPSPVEVNGKFSLQKWDTLCLLP